MDSTTNEDLYFRDYTKMTDDEIVLWDERWPNFAPHEIACRETKELLIVPFALDQLQKVRNKYGNSLRVASGYRSIAYNRKIGGAKNSAHTRGAAFDISTRDMSGAALHAFLIAVWEVGPLGFGMGKNDGGTKLLHLDWDATLGARSWFY